jgi:hypothetical protein
VRTALVLRHLVAVAVLPFTVAVVILAHRDSIRPALGGNLGAVTVQAAGLACLALGLMLFDASLRRFAGKGRAPWRRGTRRGGSSSGVRTATCAIR